MGGIFESFLRVAMIVLIVGPVIRLGRARGRKGARRCE